jgi:hypothetical protein
MTNGADNITEELMTRPQIRSSFVIR